MGSTTERVLGHFVLFLWKFLGGSEKSESEWHFC